MCDSNESEQPLRTGVKIGWREHIAATYEIFASSLLMGCRKLFSLMIIGCVKIFFGVLCAKFF